MEKPPIAEENIEDKPDLIVIKPELVKMEEEPDGDTIRWPSQDIGCQYAKGKVEAPGEYFFENDHLAMLEEGREDLQVLLRTLAVLEAQKVTIYSVIHMLSSNPDSRSKQCKIMKSS